MTRLSFIMAARSQRGGSHRARMRRLRRFFSPTPLLSEGQKLLLPSSEARHIHRSLRLKVGDHCLLSDGLGREVEAEICHYKKDGSVQLEVVKVLKPSSNPLTSHRRGDGGTIAEGDREESLQFLDLPCQNNEGRQCLKNSEGTHGFFSARIRVRVCQALVQRIKMDFFVQKAQELDAEEIWPLATERTVVKMSPEKTDAVLLRWQKVAQEAVKQSGTLTLIKVAAPRPLAKALQDLGPRPFIGFFHPSGNALSFREWLQRVERQVAREPESVVSLFFGPEGGFSDKEIKAFENLAQRYPDRCQQVCLGTQILKAETAFVGVLAALKFCLGTRL